MKLHSFSFSTFFPLAGILLSEKISRSFQHKEMELQDGRERKRDRYKLNKSETDKKIKNSQRKIEKCRETEIVVKWDKLRTTRQRLKIELQQRQVVRTEML